MLRVLVVIGIVLAVVGAVLAFVPFLPGPSQVLTAVHPTAAFNATTSGSLTGYWTIGLTWTANQTVSLLVLVCHSINLTASSLHTVCPGAAPTVLNGTSGSGSYSVPVGGALLIGILSNTASSPRVHIQLQPTMVFAGTILLFGGIGIAVVGLLPRPRARPAATAVASPPSAESAEGPASGNGHDEGGSVVLR